MTNFRRWLVLGCFGCSTASAIESHLGVGYDSNPHQLPEEAGFISGVYTDIFVDGEKQIFEYPVYIELELRRKDYRPVQIEAANSYGGLGLGYHLPINDTWLTKFYYNYRLFDTTYISRETGELAEFGATSLSDRFDAKWHDLSFFVTGSLTEFLNIQADFHWQDKRYSTLAEPSFSSIDNVNWQLNGGVTANWQGFGAEFTLGYFSKSYQGRRAVDLQGQPLDSDLSYGVLSTDLVLHYRYEKRFYAAIGLLIADQSDDHDGYFDMEDDNYFIELHYTTDDDDRIETRYEVVEHVFANPDGHVIDEFDEWALRDQDGYRWTASYHIKLKEGKDYNFEFYAEWQLDSYQSIDDLYSYDRQTFLIGVSSEF